MVLGVLEVVLVVLEVVLVVLGVVLVVLGVVLRQCSEQMFGTDVRNRQCSEQCSEPNKLISRHVTSTRMIRMIRPYHPPHPPPDHQNHLQDHQNHLQDHQNQTDKKPPKGGLLMWGVLMVLEVVLVVLEVVLVVLEMVLVVLRWFWWSWTRCVRVGGLWKTTVLGGGGGGSWLPVVPCTAGIKRLVLETFIKTTFITPAQYLY